MTRRRAIGWAWGLAVFLAGGAPPCRADNPPDRPNGVVPRAADKGSLNRFDDVIFTLPGNWRRLNHDDYAAIDSPDVPPLEWFNIRIFRSYETTSSPRQVLEMVAGNLSKIARTMNGNDVVESRHPAGWDAVARTYTIDTNDNKKITWTVYVAKSGSRAQVIYYLANDSALWKNRLGDFETFVRDMRLAHSTELAPGDAPGAAPAGQAPIPPLTLLMVSEAQDFLEWYMDVHFTREQFDELERVMIDAWKRKDRDEINGVPNLSMIGFGQLEKELLKFPRDRREYAREKSRGETIEALRKLSDYKFGQMLVRIYDAGHQPIATGGGMALTRQASDASLEMFYFLACQVEGVEDVKPTPGEKDQWAKNLAERFPALDDAHRKAMADMATTWAGVRVEWAAISDDQRAAFKKVFADAEPMKTLRPHVRELALLQAQARFQRQNANYAMLSNMSARLHAANMIVYSNMGGNTRYEWARH